jgi:hypothetical protein
VGLESLDQHDELDEDDDMTFPHAFGSPANTTYTLQLELRAPNGASRTVAVAAFEADGELSFSSDDPEQFDHSLAVLAAARFAELPISTFSRSAVRQMFDLGEAASIAHHSVFQLITEPRANAKTQARRDQLVKRHFEAVLNEFAAALVHEAITSDATEEDQGDPDTWVPSDRLIDERDRILTFGGQEAMSAREVVEYLGVTRTTLATRRSRGSLLALPLGSDRKLVYPRWQFDPERPTQVVPGLEAAIAGFGQKDPWGVADILITPHPALDGEVPILRLLASRGADADRIRDLLASAYL